VIPEKTAPTMKKPERPSFSTVSLNCVDSGTGRKYRTITTITAKTARVRNWRERYAAAPSCTAPAISFMLSVPSLAARTSRARTQATPKAATATRPTMATRV